MEVLRGHKFSAPLGKHQRSVTVGSCGRNTFGETTRTSPRVAIPSESPPVTSTWCHQHPGFGPFLLVYSGPNPTFEEIHYLVSGQPKHNIRTAGPGLTTSGGHGTRHPTQQLHSDPAPCLPSDSKYLQNHKILLFSNAVDIYFVHNMQKI